MQKTAIITGMGMDAKTLSHILLSKDYHVVLTYRRNTLLDVSKVLSVFAADLKKYPKSSLRTVFMDITDQNSIANGILDVLRTHKTIDEFYHLAAMSNVGDSFKSEILAVTTNGHSAFYSLDALKRYSKGTRFYFANTSECFGGDPARCPFNEDSPQELRSPYSWGKNLGANITKYFRQTYDMYACFGWLFNHSNIYRDSSFFFGRVIEGACRIALEKQNELKLGNLEFWRDEHLSDFGCEMMWKMLNNSAPKDYVIGNGQANHGKDYLEHAFGYFGLDWKNYVVFDESRLRPNEVVKLVADPKRAIEDLGWKPNRINLQDHVYLVTDHFLKKEKGERDIPREDPLLKF